MPKFTVSFDCKYQKQREKISFSTGLDCMRKSLFSPDLCRRIIKLEITIFENNQF